MKKQLLVAVLSLLSAAASAEESPHCRIVKLASLPIRFVGNQPSVIGKFNGVDLTLVMDSGAQTTFLFPQAVKKAGLREAHSSLTSSGVGGVTETYAAWADEARIGPSHSKKVPFVEVMSPNAPADGLVGADYLFRTDLDVLLRDGLVNFITPDNCGDTSLADWEWVASRDMAPNDWRQQIEVKINGASFTAMLDSGATRSVLDLEAAKRIGITPESEGTVVDGQSTGIGDQKMALWRARIQSFEIGSEAIKNTAIEIADLYGAARKEAAGLRLDRIEGADMFLGADFMRAHHLIFARSQRRLYFTYIGGPVFSVEATAQELADQAGHYRTGAENNQPADMYYYALYLFQGRGVEKDLIESYKWLLIASQGPWAASHARFKADIDRGIAALLKQLDEKGQAEAKSRAAAWTPPQ